MSCKWSSSDVASKILYAFPFPSIRAKFPAHLILLVILSIWLEAQTTKLRIMQFSPVSAFKSVNKWNLNKIISPDTDFGRLPSGNKPLCISLSKCFL